MAQPSRAPYGVHIDQVSSGNVIEGNLIGTDVSGKKPLGNTLSGVYVSGGSNGNVIGGTTAVAGNRISYNGLNGVHIDEGSDGNSVAFDTLDDNASDGVFIEGTLNTIVSNCTSESNERWGILVTGSSGFKLSNNTVSQNEAGGEKD